MADDGRNHGIRQENDNDGEIETNSEKPDYRKIPGMVGFHERKITNYINNAEKV